MLLKNIFALWGMNCQTDITAQITSIYFFQLISRRYEKKSTIITSNKNLSKWSELFKDPVITNAILDRLLHHSKVIQMIGPSYRTKDLILADKESEEQSQNW